MPKPYLLDRPSGRYVRFYLPLSLRECFHKRFLVRRLPADPDLARLLSAGLAVALSQAKRLAERGRVVDVDEILKRFRAGKVDELLTLEGLTLPNGAKLDKASIDTPEDYRLFQQTVEDIGKLNLPAGFAPSSPVKPSTGVLLDSAIATHLGDLVDQVDNKTLTESRHSLKIFLGLTGNVPVGDITPDHCRTFLREVKHYPRNATKRQEFQGLTVRQAIAKAKKLGEKAIAGHTLAKHYSRLNVFLASLVADNLITHNPLSSRHLPKNEDDEMATGRAFTRPELSTIFGDKFLPWAKKYPHRFWGSILGLYSGARVNEIAQLYVGDFEQVGDRWGFHIAKTHPDQKLKNKASMRFVPLALPVVKAGFLDYLASVQTPRLFPHLPNKTGLGYGRQLSRQFSDFIKANGIDERGLGFHGFRHTFASLLDEAGASVAEIALLTGHSGSKTKTVLETFYIESKKRRLGKVNPQAFRQACQTLDKFKPDIAIPTWREWQALNNSKV